MSVGDVQTGQASAWTPERVALTGRTIGLVSAGGVALGLFASALQLYWVAASIGGLLVVLLVSWQFEAALALYAVVAFIPWGQSPGLTGGSGMSKGVYVSEVMLGFLLVVWFGKYITGTLPAKRIRTGFYVPLALYVIYCVINVVSSFLFWDYHVNRIYQYPQVNVVELGLHVLSAGALVMIATSISEGKWVRYVTIALLAAGTYNGLNSLLGGVIPVAAPWSSLIMYLPAGYALAIALDTGRSRPVRGAALAGVLLAIGLIFIKGISWVSGWLGLSVVLGTILYIKSRRGFLICALVALVLGTIAKPFLYKNVVEYSQSEGDYDRFALMAGALRYATTFPLGVGLGNYRSYNSFYYGERWGTTSYTSAHGTYSQHLSETGIPGIVLFVAILVSGFRWMLANYRKMPPGPSRTYLLAAMGQLAGISAAAAIGDYIIPSYHNGGIVNFSTTVYSWLIWGLATAHVRISKDEADGSLDRNS